MQMKTLYNNPQHVKCHHNYDQHNDATQHDNSITAASAEVSA